MNRLAGGILLIFVAVSLVPLLLFGFRKEALSFALCGGLVAGAVALLVSRMIIRPLQDLTEGIKRLGNGNLNYRLPVSGSDEIARLASAFNNMADSLGKRNELEDYIVRKNRELFALNTISAITSQSMDLDEILKNTVTEVTAITGMDAGGIYWVDEQKREIVCAGHVGVPDRLVRQMEKFKFGEDIPGFVAITGDTVAISNVSKDPRTLMHAVKETGMQGYLCLPLKSKGMVQGILCMLSQKEHSFTPEELEFLGSVGHIVGVAIENIKLYHRERSRLSGLVHVEKNRAEAILSSIGEGVYTTDRDFHITYWNKAAETITGFNAGDAVGKTCIEILGHVDEQGELLCGSRCVMRRYPEGRTDTQAAFCSTSRGRKLPTALTSTPVKNEAGEEIGRVTVFRDITLEIEADRMKTDFVRTVSHEIRTPLSTIVGIARMLKDGEIKDDKAAHEYLTSIHIEGQRLASMVEELLDIARIESGMQEIRKTEVSLQPVIESCIEVLTAPATAKGVRIHWDRSKILPPLLADREKIHRVVFNLLNNAICYCDRGAAVTINSETKNGYLSLSLEDTGWGIPEQDLPYIFKKFYRAKMHAHRVRGTGLGLPLVLEIVKAHNGTIDVESTPGKGSRFIVRMPIAM
jgi:PAS domain S-box-containing protein